MQLADWLWKLRDVFRLVYDSLPPLLLLLRDFSSAAFYSDSPCAAARRFSLSKSMPDLISNKKSWRAQRIVAKAHLQSCCCCCCCCVSFSPLTFHFPVHLSVGERGAATGRGTNRCAPSLLSLLLHYFAPVVCCIGRRLPASEVCGWTRRRRRRRHRRRAVRRTKGKSDPRMQTHTPSKKR